MNTSRLIISDARKSVFRIGVARNRLSSLRMRMSTVTKPTPHSPPPIRLMPSRPGTRKSMYRPPRLVHLLRLGRHRVVAPGRRAAAASFTSSRASLLSGRVGTNS